MALNTFDKVGQTTPNLLEGLITFSTRTITIPNSTGRVARVVTVTPGVATQEATTYRLKETLTNESISVVSDATPTASEVITLLIAAFRANPILNGLFTVSGTTTLVITSRKTGDTAAFNFIDNGSTPTNVLTIAETTADADPIALPMGRAIVVNNNGQYSRLSSALSSTNVFAGIAGFTQADIAHNPELLVPSYPKYSAVNLLRKGEIAVYSDSAVDPTASVYGVFATGRFTAVSAAGNSQITSGVSWGSKTTGAGLAILRLGLS